MQRLSLIAAIAKNRVIGKGNDLIWKDIPGDMKWFVDKTRGHTVIMGRKTYDSLRVKPLPKRKNIVISRNKDLVLPGCIVVPSVEDAMKAAWNENEEEVFVIGGGEIYDQTIDRADRLYLTLIEADAEGDVFFPDYSEFKRLAVPHDPFPPSGGFPHSYSFLVLERSEKEESGSI